MILTDKAMTVSEEFQLHKMAVDCAAKYFGAGVGREIGVRNTMFDLFWMSGRISSWEAGRLADRAWTALEKQMGTGGRG
jgi:hypothetical protein